MPDRTIGRIDYEISRLQKRLRRNTAATTMVQAELEKLRAERELAMEEHSVTDIHLVGMSDDELNAKARYYRGKIEATSDPAWVLRWQRRHLAVLKELNARLMRQVTTSLQTSIDEFKAEQKDREDKALAQSRWYVTRGQKMPVGFFDYINGIRARRGMTTYKQNPVTDHIDIQAAQRIRREWKTEEGRAFALKHSFEVTFTDVHPNAFEILTGVVIDPATSIDGHLEDGTPVTRTPQGTFRKVEPLYWKKEDTMKPGTVEANISIYNPEPVKHRDVRSILSDRYALNFDHGIVRINAPSPKFNIDRASAQLTELKVPHSILVNPGSSANPVYARSLVADLSFDAFKRLLASLL